MKCLCRHVNIWGVSPRGRYKISEKGGGGGPGNCYVLESLEVLGSAREGMGCPDP